MIRDVIHRRAARSPLRQSALRAASRLPVRRLREEATEFLTVPADHIVAGRHTYFTGRPSVHVYPGAPDERVRVGSFCSIAAEVVFILSGNHDPRRVTTSPVRLTFGVEGYETSGELSGRGDIVLGNDVWVGAGAMLLSGARVGDGAVVGARAVVSGSVPPYAVVVGNPAREVRRRFDPRTVERLVASAWWDLPDEVLRPALDLLSGRDVAAFLDHVESLG